MRRFCFLTKRDFRRDLDSEEGVVVEKFEV